MSKRIYTKEDWNEFRNEILELVILYKHVNEHLFLSEEQAQEIKSFYFFSKKNTIKAFYIQLGFILSNGSPTLRDFVSEFEEDYKEILNLYSGKIKDIRDKGIAHNVKSKIKGNDPVKSEDIDNLFTKVLETVKKIDETFDDPYHYDFVSNSDGIKSLIPLIENSIQLTELQDQIVKNNFKALVEMDVESGEIKIVK